MILFRRGFLLVLVGGALSLDTPVNMCSGVSPKDSLSDKMNLPSDYKIEGTRTDWVANTTSYFTETSYNGQRSVAVSNRTSSDFFVRLAQGSIYAVNESSCVLQKEIHPLDLAVSGFSIDDSSVSSFINEIIKFSSTNHGQFNDSAVVAGVEGVTWVSCVNDTKTGVQLQVEVVFAGDMSFAPASASFQNPQMLFARLSEFDLKHNSSLTKSVSFSFDRRSGISAKDNSLFEIPSGVVCNGWNSSVIPLKFSDPVNLVVSNKTVTFELFYSQQKNLAVVTTSGLKNGDVVPFFDTPAKDATIFAHDFFTGYEYILGSDRCAGGFEAIPETSAEVLMKGDKFSMKSLVDVFVNTSLIWQDYGKITNEIGNVFRAVNSLGNVFEIVNGGETVILRVYSKGSLVSSTTITILNSAQAPTVAPLVSECYANHQAPNGSFMITVKNQQLSTIYSIGQEIVTTALAESLNSIAPICHYRIRAFFNENPDSSLGVFFRVAEKSESTPSATTSSYDYQGEVLTAELFDKLNKTMAEKDWKFNVVVEGKPVEFTVAAASLSHFPPPPPPPGPPPFEGYTGGAMFVLGLFSLVFGCAIGAGSLFFITKRQRISTLAYQVFE